MKLRKKNAVIEILIVCLEYTFFIYKQPAYKQLALGWQITKQLSGLNLFSLSNNKNYRLKEKWGFSFVINIKQLLNRQCSKIQPSQKHYSENLKSVIININFEP